MTTQDSEIDSLSLSTLKLHWMSIDMETGETPQTRTAAPFLLPSTATFLSLIDENCTLISGEPFQTRNQWSTRGWEKEGDQKSYFNVLQMISLSHNTHRVPCVWSVITGCKSFTLYWSGSGGDSLLNLVENAFMASAWCSQLSRRNR